MGVEEFADRPLYTGDDSASETTYRTLTAGDAPFARFERPRAASPTTVAVVSDPHVSVDERGSWKLYHRTQRRLREAVSDVEAQGADALVVAGDLSKDGERRNLRWVQSVLDSAGVPVLCIPGNHDVKERSVAHFERRFTDDGFPVHLSLDGPDVVGLNSAMALDADGEREAVVSADQLAWLEETLPETTDPIVVSHHNLPGLADHIGGDGWAPHPPLANADELTDVLSRHDVPLHLSGHVHLAALVRYRGVRGLVAPALSSFPQSYLLLEIDEMGTTVHCRTTATESGLEEAYDHSLSHSARSETIAGLTAEQLTRLPLVDERTDETGEIPPIHRP
ncbi:metallophosphoesterase family protein [Halogeometricum limi]|uniref:Calcineurin-like phosphoesterase n=1 Tax=Halogeometricum limi TaxID=555875 RepID=A0A1I6G121_9EURY|nr:metallophosphoesterase [Halogeometricum limi]SFR35889.1 Calcineurin-like phosphoesterase [Halogeometricum limi]